MVNYISIMIHELHTINLSQDFLACITSIIKKTSMRKWGSGLAEEWLADQPTNKIKLLVSGKSSLAVSLKPHSHMQDFRWKKRRHWTHKTKAMNRIDHHTWSFFSKSIFFFAKKHKLINNNLRFIRMMICL